MIMIVLIAYVVASVLTNSGRNNVDSCDDDGSWILTCAEERERYEQSMRPRDGWLKRLVN